MEEIFLSHGHLIKKGRPTLNPSSTSSSFSDSSMDSSSFENHGWNCASFHDSPQLSVITSEKRKRTRVIKPAKNYLAIILKNVLFPKTCQGNTEDTQASKERLNEKNVSMRWKGKFSLTKKIDQHRWFCGICNMQKLWISDYILCKVIM